MKINLTKVASGLFRAGHWLIAASVLGLLVTGAEIYNAAPFWGFELPKLVPEKMGLTEALRWHLFLPWLLAFGLAIVLFERAVRRTALPGLTPVSIKGITREIKNLFKGALVHPLEDYLFLQRLIYLCVFAALGMMFLTGLCLWKPVQLQVIGDALGGYEVCRRMHFFGFAFLAGFLLVHVVMALLTPLTLSGMVLGFKPGKEIRNG